MGSSEDRNAASFLLVRLCKQRFVCPPSSHSSRSKCAVTHTATPFLRIFLVSLPLSIPLLLHMSPFFERNIPPFFNKTAGLSGSLAASTVSLCLSRSVSVYVPFFIYFSKTILLFSASLSVVVKQSTSTFWPLLAPQCDLSETGTVIAGSGPRKTHLSHSAQSTIWPAVNVTAA